MNQQVGSPTQGCLQFVVADELFSASVGKIVIMLRGMPHIRRNLADTPMRARRLYAWGH
jgi:hypothetical protein